MATAYQDMVDSYNRLAYMVKTTAPHLQSFINDLQVRIKATITEAAVAPPSTPRTPGVIIPPPKR